MPRIKSGNLLERLRDFEAEVLMFMSDPLVSFTNNQGENDIRMRKVQQQSLGAFAPLMGHESLAVCEVIFHLPEAWHVAD